MKVVVTGGGGFIGSHLVDACVSAGHTVAVVDDFSTGDRGNLNPDAAVYEVDIRNPALGRAFDEENPEIVFHLAAQMDVRKSLEDPRFDADVNVGGTIQLLELARKGETKKFIFASTGGAIYGEPSHLPADETCPPAPLSHYGVSKLACEKYIELYYRLYGLDYTLLRFPNVYGPRQNPHGEAGVCAILARLMLDGKAPTLYGHGEPQRDYVYVEDIVRGCLLAVEGASQQTVNLGSGIGTSVQELFDIYRELLGCELSPVLEPLRQGEVNRIYTTGSRAAELLGWEPEVDLREGLKRTLEDVRARAAMG